MEETDTECADRLFAEGINLLINEVSMQLFSITFGLYLTLSVGFSQLMSRMLLMLSCHLKL